MFGLLSHIFLALIEKCRSVGTSWHERAFAVLARRLREDIAHRQECEQTMLARFAEDLDKGMKARDREKLRKALIEFAKLSSPFDKSMPQLTLLMTKLEAYPVPESSVTKLPATEADCAE